MNYIKNFKSDSTTLLANRIHDPPRPPLTNKSVSTNLFRYIAIKSSTLLVELHIVLGTGRFIGLYGKILEYQRLKIFIKNHLSFNQLPMNPMFYFCSMDFLLFGNHLIWVKLQITWPSLTLKFYCISSFFYWFGYRKGMNND